MTATLQSHEHPAEMDRQRLVQLRQQGLEVRHCFDVGASNGCWSNHVSEEFPETNFELFEPLVEYAPSYREKLEPRLLRHSKFRLHRLALGPECQRASMWLYPSPADSTALPVEVPAAGARRVEVDMVTLDYAVEEFGLPSPEVLKIDTQGCELAILRGAVRTLPRIRVLVLECWLTRAYGESTPLLIEVANWLRAFEFQLYDFGGSWRDPTGRLVAQDCIFTKPWG